MDMDAKDGLVQEGREINGGWIEDGWRMDLGWKIDESLGGG